MDLAISNGFVEIRVDHPFLVAVSAFLRERSTYENWRESSIRYLGQRVTLFDDFSGWIALRSY